MNIKDGGPTENLQKDKTINEIKIFYESGRVIQLWINDNCLSYLTISEALNLKGEIQKALGKLVG